jgi:hypothetical protein
METDGVLVGRDEPVYREFVRLYHLARGLRPTSVDRWNGDLLNSPVGHLGGFSPTTGRIRLAGDSILRHLDPGSTTTTRYERAEALATVLHESTHAGMETDAAHEPNAVRSRVSTAAMEGMAELRTVADFEMYTAVAGYPGLVIGRPQYAGAFAAMDDLVDQVTGPALDRQALITDAVRGPGAMHFDQLANAAIRNRLAEVIPPRAEDQLRVRAALIKTMTHPLWPTLLGDRPPEAGTMVANEIRQHLNQRIDEIHHHYRANPRTPFPADVPNPAALQLATASDQPTQVKQATAASGVEMRFLDAQAPASRATSFRPSLGQGARGAGGPTAPKLQRPTERRWD